MNSVDVVIEAFVDFGIVIGVSCVAYLLVLFMIDARRMWQFRKDIRHRRRR